jgi:formate hydrogenlyase transcriptional activator
MSNESSPAGPRIQKPVAANARVARPSRSPVTAARDDLEILRAVVVGTAGSTGEEFFKDLVSHLASSLGVPFAAISEFSGVNGRVRTLAFSARGRIQENFEYDLAGTPCEEVTHGRLCHYPSGVKDRFPLAKPLVGLGVQGYLGTPLFDVDGNVVGLLAVFDEKPMPAEPRHLYLLQIFAARVAAVLERLRAEQKLSASERRYRDLYDEAPVGYLCVGVDGRIQSVNGRASQMVGFSAEELVGRAVADLFADTPAGKSREADFSKRLLSGEELSGLEVEMRRKDGQPLWISLWMKPIRGEDAEVRASRSIWVNITDRVLADAERARLQQQNLYLQDEIKAAQNFEAPVGDSPALREVLEKVRIVAPTETSVLITGETGTGKELLARAIHAASSRRHGPLIKINCAALPAGLVESELFGHEKGAFTGAIARRNGRFELANGGTIFLDEVGEIPAETQVKLLRVLQEREFERVGGSSPLKVDIRILAATNRDLFKAVQEKTFREDLYYRLNVFPIALPPLRERKEDIPLLVHFLVRKFSTRIGRRIDGVTEEVMRQLVGYPWPGNVRELENVLERAVILTTGTTVGAVPDLLPITDATPSVRQQLTLESVEREHIVAVLRQTDGVVEGPRGAARILGLHPNTLRNRMKKLGVSRPSHQMR